MNLPALIDSLERFADLLPVLVDGLSDADLRWKPPSGAWSVLEIVCHLRDEEMDDFRARTKMALESHPDPWPGIDPVGWARERKYNEHDFDSALTRFLEERAKSIAWLRSLDAPEWDNAWRHPLGHVLRAGDFLTAWVAHDQLHARQITKRRFEMIARDGAPYEARYAGDWTA